MKRAFAILAVIYFAAVFNQSCCSKTISITTNSSPNAVIILEKDATLTEQTAASELAFYLKEISGADIPIQSSPQSTAKTRIFIGQTATVKSMLPEFHWNQLKSDGILIKTVGDDLILAGDRPRGPIYAVYTFLEDKLGIRWWTPSDTCIPKSKTIKIKSIDHTYTPQFRYRETYYQSVVDKNPEFANRIRINGAYQSTIPVERGGHVWMIGGCHTFGQIIPSEVYFKEHPDWFSEINGVRQNGYTQLCLSNAEMQKEFIRIALERVKAYSEAGIISVSQNDNVSYCQCKDCQELLKETGSQSGSLVWFVNKVAEEVEKIAPDFLVDTIAYQYTQDAPTKIKPRSNVLIRLCSIQANFGFPLSSKENKVFYTDLSNWRKLTDKLFIWDYTVNFANLQVPHPNILNLGSNMRTFAANNVLGVFAQGDGYNPDTGFAVMKNWVLAHLLWNPKSDDKRLIKDFLRGYYGPAAPHLWEYIVKTQEAVYKQKPNLACFNIDYTFYTLKQLEELNDIFTKAQQSVANDAVLSKRVAIQRMPLDHLLLLNRARLADLDWAKQIKWNSMLSNYFKVAQETGNLYITEGGLMTPVYKANLLHLAKTPVRITATTTPQSCQGFKRSEWAEIQQDRFGIHQEVHVGVKTADIGTSDGLTAMVTGASHDWVVSAWIQDKDIVAKKVKCYAAVKVTAKSKSGKAFNFGLYDRANNITVEKEFKLEDIKDSNYHEYYLGEFELHNKHSFFVAPPGDADAVDYVWVDRFIIAASK